jgi:hypothetical protein
MAVWSIPNSIVRSIPRGVVLQRDGAVFVRPGSAHLTWHGGQSHVEATLMPGAAHLTWHGGQPAVTAPALVSPGSAHLVWHGGQPAVSNGDQHEYILPGYGVISIDSTAVERILPGYGVINEG